MERLTVDRRGGSVLRMRTPSCPSCGAKRRYFPSPGMAPETCPKCGNLISSTCAAGEFHLPHSEGDDHLAFIPWPIDTFPYVYWSPVIDLRTSSEHRQMETLGIDGTDVYYCNDPAIRQYWLNEMAGLWPCRCCFTPLTVERAAGRGVREAAIWYATRIPPAQFTYVTMPFDPWIPPTRCMLVGWGTKGIPWKMKDHRRHPGNPDKW